MQAIDSFNGYYRWLSNFFPSVVWYDGVLYYTVEHAYQAAKLKDSKLRNEVRLKDSPGGAKNFVRELLDTDPSLRVDNWELISLDTMEFLLRQKFSGNLFSKRLEATQDRPLVEGNSWHDNFYGMCKCSACKPLIKCNHLGKLLMQIRADNRRTLFREIQND